MEIRIRHLIVGLVIAGAAAFALVPPVLAGDIHDAESQLQAPLAFGERYPALRFLAYLFADEAQPHLRAIHELARTHDPNAALVLIQVMTAPGFPYRFEAGVALQDVPNPVSVPALISLVEDGDERLARMAARVLGRVARKLADPSSAEVVGRAPNLDASRAIEGAQTALVRVARDHPNEVVRVAALTGLLSIGSEDALFNVYEIGSKDSHPMVRCRLLSATGDFMSLPRGSRVTPGHMRTLLRKSLDPRAVDEPLGVIRRAYLYSIHFSRAEPEDERRSDCVDVNETAMWWLASLNDPEVIPHLIRAAESNDPALQAVAAWGLPRFNHEQAFERVGLLLESPYSGVRSAVIEGLGRSKHPAADALLMQVLATGSRLDRRDAARALAGSFGASLALIESFSDPAVEVRNEAEQALLRSDVVVRKLEDTLASSLAEIEAGRGTAALNKRVERIRDGLAKWQGERRDAEQALVRGLAADDPRIRMRSVRILSRYTSESSLDLLIEVLDAGQVPSAEAAVLSLGLRGNAKARDAIERALASEDEDLSVAAIRAIQDLNTTESLSVLRAIRIDDASPRKSAALRYTIALLERRSS